MSKLSNMVSVLLALLANVTSAVAGDLPRLWEVTRRDTLDPQGKFFILPVTHNGLDAEYDNYFFKTILPVALQADIFLQESAVMVPREMPSCQLPLADTAENREILRKAYADVERAVYDRRPRLSRPDSMTDQIWAEFLKVEHLLAHNEAAELSEYGLITAMGEALNEFIKKQHQDFSRKIDYTPRPDIADFIQHQRWLKGIKSNEPIESASDLAAAYCNINPAQRGRYLQREIDRADPLKFKPMLAETRARGNIVFVESIQTLAISKRFDFYEGDEYDEHIVCDRNEKWLDKMRDGVGGGIRFYAVGMAHVFQQSSGSQSRCDGLLKRLRDEGFTVKLLK